MADLTKLMIEYEASTKAHGIRQSLDRLREADAKIDSALSRITGEGR